MFYLNRMCLRAPLVALAALGLVNAAPNGRDPRSYQSQLPGVWPPPQEMSSSGGKPIPINGAVTIVTDTEKSAAVDAVKAAVSTAGGEASISSEACGDGTQIYIGTGAEDSAAATIANALSGNSVSGLAADGYVLVSGQYKHRPTIVLNGVDKRGAFYASQTLRQIVDGDQVPTINVRDEPLMSIRGSIEGFYGIPWSHKARLDQLVFYGKHKMNTYIYTPKDDQLLRAKWRDLYSGEAVSDLKDLIEAANANEVDFTFALSPGLDICYSSDEDFNATVAKFEQVRELGAHSFYIALDDIPLEFHCDADKEKWEHTDDFRWIARAQTHYLNRLQEEYIKPNDFNDLQTVPTNYAGSEPDPYKEEFGTLLDKNVRIQWTGEGVFSDEITVKSVKQAAETYVTENLYLWDNFPVNDGERGRLFLNPLTGRAAELYKYLLGFTSNPLIQPYASMPALANYADYTWNGIAYDADKSMEAALMELAGDDNDVYEALVAFSDLNQNWPYRTPEVHSPKLDKDIAAFWAARKSSPSYEYNKEDGTQALRDRLELLTTLPEVLPNMAMKGFADDVAPWSTLSMQWAKACQKLINMLDALDGGDKDKADSEFEAAKEWVEKTKAKTVDDRDENGEDHPNSIVPTAAKQAFDSFLGNATAIYEGK